MKGVFFYSWCWGRGGGFKNQLRLILIVTVIIKLMNTPFYVLRYLIYILLIYLEQGKSRRVIYIYILRVISVKWFYVIVTKLCCSAVLATTKLCCSAVLATTKLCCSAVLATKIVKMDRIYIVPNRLTYWIFRQFSYKITKVDIKTFSKQFIDEIRSPWNGFINTWKLTAYSGY